jgi:hypothetical protein
MMKRRTPSRRSPAIPTKPPTRRRSVADRAAAEHLLAVLKTGGDVRKTKVQKLRRSVRRRTYENELKLAVALERLTREL